MRYLHRSISLCCLVALVSLREAQADVHILVGTPEQGGQYTSVQAAVDAVPSSGSERYVIDIMPGTYQERVFVVPNKVTLRGMGESPSDTKLTYFETANTPPNESTVHASTVIRGSDFIAENLTFENSYGTGVQALAIYVRGDRAIFNNVRFLGWQDTLRSESGRHYFYESYIEGSVDFIYGKGTAYFENSTLFAKSSGYLTAQGREQADESNGYVFKNSTITGTAPNGSVYLGRPWQAYSRAIFIDTKMGPLINSAGWSQWPGNNNHLTAFFAEFNSMDLAGNPLNVSGRVGWSHQLTPQEAAAFSKETWLAGSDGWNPIVPFQPDPSADFDGDGDVDGADFLTWQRNPTIGDLADWQANYLGNATTATSAVIPEPASMILLVLLVSCIAVVRCRTCQEFPSFFPKGWQRLVKNRITHWKHTRWSYRALAIRAPLPDLRFTPGLTGQRTKKELKSLKTRSPNVSSNETHSMANGTTKSIPEIYTNPVINSCAVPMCD